MFRTRTSFACLILSLTALPASAQTTLSDQIEALLRGNPQFHAQIPAGHRLSKLELEARPAPGPLVWGASPETLGRIVHGVATERHVNCDFDEPSTASGKLEGAWTESFSFATERGGSIAVEVSVSANFPFGSASGSVTGTVSSSVTKTTSEGMTLTFSPSYARMVAPRHYFDAQLQITELRVEGQPFHMDIEVGGDARVSYLPDVKWIDAPSAPREMLVLAGSEPVGAGSSRRNLHICKAGIHPGKVVAGNCNWTYGGNENRARRYQMLLAPRGSYEWKARADFETAHSDADVARGNSPAVATGRENRADRYNGRLLVCRAEYRGGTHPGKVVINHCMIGYGGSEIQIGDYDVLVSKDTKAVTKRVEIAEYVPPERRTFRIEGVFEGGRALEARIVRSAQRPVTDEMCPGDEIIPMAAKDSTDGPGTAVVFTRMPARVDASGGSADVAGEKVEIPPLDGEVLARIDLDTKGGEDALRYEFRTLRLSEPMMWGSDVLALQQALTEAGWPVREDGFYGRYTERAVRLFQAANRLASDGVVGPRTEARLQD